MENNKKAKQGKDNKNEMNIETKKESKILVQGGFQPLTFLYVFTELPTGYREECEKRKSLAPEVLNEKKLRLFPKECTHF